MRLKQELGLCRHARRTGAGTGAHGDAVQRAPAHSSEPSQGSPGNAASSCLDAGYLHLRFTIMLARKSPPWPVGETVGAPMKCPSCANPTLWICISDAFRAMQRSGVTRDRCLVIRKLAALEDLPRSRRTMPGPVARAGDKFFVFLFSGTLGLKQIPRFSCYSRSLCGRCRGCLRGGI